MINKLISSMLALSMLIGLCPIDASADYQKPLTADLLRPPALEERAPAADSSHNIPEKPFFVSFQIPYPVEIFKEELITPDMLQDEATLTRRLEKNIYYANAPPQRQKQIAARVRNAASVVVPFVIEYLKKKHPSLELVNISMYGSYPFGDEESMAGDIDFTICVRGSYLAPMEEVDLDFGAPPLNGLIRRAPKLSMVIVGEDNFRAGTPHRASTVPEGRQRLVIDGTVPLLSGRNIVLYGRDFNHNQNLLNEHNLLAKVSELILNAYRRLYNVYDPGHRAPERDARERVKIAVSRLYDIALYLKRLDPKADIILERIFSMRRRFEHEEIGFGEIDKTWKNLDRIYRNLCPGPFTRIVQRIFYDKGFIIEGPSADDGWRALVYKAREISTGRTVAIKIAKPPEYMTAGISRYYSSSMSRHISFWKREGIFNHSFPVLVRLYDAGEIPSGKMKEYAKADNIPQDLLEGFDWGYHYQIMEFLDGKNAEELLRKGSFRGKNISVLLDSVAEFADGINEIHNKGLAHNELLPKNIVVGPGMKLKACDLDPTDYLNPAAREKDLKYLFAATRTILNQAAADGPYSDDIWDFFVTWDKENRILTMGPAAFAEALRQLEVKISKGTFVLAQ